MMGSEFHRERIQANGGADMGYGGDDSLAQQLRAAGSDTSVADVRSLVAGIAAAPLTDSDRWVPLVTAEADPPLLDELTALRDEFRAEYAYPPLDSARVKALRELMVRREVHGFIVPRADAHQGEYVSLHAERLQWLTGFAGSAGAAVVLREKAALFVDGRYTIAAKDQVDTSLFPIEHLIDAPPETWLSKNLRAGQRFAYDPWLHTVAGARKLRKACAKVGAELVATENLVDAVWDKQPPPPLGTVVVHDLEFAGKDTDDKRHELGDELLGSGTDAAILTAPDSIAWLLNIRGADVPRTPLPLSFAILNSDGTVDLFIDKRKFADGVSTHLGEEVRVHAPSQLGSLLDDLGVGGLHVRVTPNTGADWLRLRLEAAGATVLDGLDPCALPKARKNDVELAGTREAHRRDGAALTRFLAWMAEVGPTGTVTEMQAADKLEAYRRETGKLLDLSFDTISGAGSNGAIVHYRVTEATDRAIEPNMLYLVDSGGQYLDGTTDVTRTIAIGTPTAEMKDRFTRVLKGHIALATVTFAPKTNGSQLDALARMPLWEAGLDYDHGTGHGVGSYLGVHEGPQNISKRLNDTPLEPGMILSNEPGYYKEGAYGIRIENLVTVALKKTANSSEMLGFETITLAPIDRSLIDVEMLTEAERAWVDGYHATVKQTLSPRVDADTATWLASATAPLS
ncbi:MAG: Xaa-Pro aminopeptidase [Myxococcota bacterium]|jgi:Xaa-Pro aminopeptidase